MSGSIWNLFTPSFYTPYPTYILSFPFLSSIIQHPPPHIQSNLFTVCHRWAYWTPDWREVNFKVATSTMEWSGWTSISLSQNCRLLLNRYHHQSYSLVLIPFFFRYRILKRELLLLFDSFEILKSSFSIGCFSTFLLLPGSIFLCIICWFIVLLVYSPLNSLTNLYISFYTFSLKGSCLGGLSNLPLCYFTGAMFYV